MIKHREMELIFQRYDHISKYFADVDIVKLRSKSFGRTNKETQRLSDSIAQIWKECYDLFSHRFLENDIKTKKVWSRI